MSHALTNSADVAPLDVLRDVTELVSLLSGWRWQVVRDAREAGATWEQTGAAIRLYVDAAEAEHEAAIARQESHRLT